jgi:hypothetical protein
MNREKAKNIAAEISAALSGIRMKYGVQTKCQRAQIYGPKTFITLRIMETNVERAAEEFRRKARVLGLEPSDLGKKFTDIGICGMTYKIIGARKHARKYPILAQNLRTGRMHKFMAIRVKAGLAGLRTIPDEWVVAC